MGKCCLKPQEQHDETAVQNGPHSSSVVVNNKLYNQNITVRKGMKSGPQFGKSEDGFEAGFQVMFCKKKIKKYCVASNVPTSFVMPQSKNENSPLGVVAS